ncbi:lipase chaperone [Shewanella surugensis]|uniref:Lipase chaperone n=1 Tax=Shewanella surugensis TaxID=212020 RepID=A0ABT0L7N1_9GAMM|nr:lipase chaperone [Shewanella surugensis]MCL1123708.1 lipase chaperone [Shewanella surugensis]
MRFRQSINQLASRILLLCLIVGSYIYLCYLITSTPHHEASVQDYTQPSKKTESNEAVQSVQITHDTDAVQQSLALIIDRHLRWQFDDIILTLQKASNLSSQSIELLTLLSEQLTLSFDATEQLFDLFSRYKHYSQAIITIKQNAPALGEQIDLNETHAFIEQITLLQTEFFNDIEINAFFENDNQYAKQTLARIAIRQDPSLSQAQKDTLLQHQISQLSETERSALQPSLDATKIAKELGSTRLINFNMDADIIIRANDIQKTNQQWKSKIIDYLSFIKSQDVAHNQQESVTENIKEYLTAHFTQNEVKRLNVFLAHPKLFQ